MRIRLLGPISVEIDGEPVVIASRRGRALLGFLAQREGTETARGILTGLLWGERGEAQARASLRQTLSELRAALAKSAQPPLNATNETVAWAPGAAWIDTKVLERAAGSEDSEALLEGAGLLRGEFMEGAGHRRARIRPVACRRA